MQLGVEHIEAFSPIASDTCRFEAVEARKFIIGKGLKCKHMLLNSHLVFVDVLQFHIRPAVLNVFGSLTRKLTMFCCYNLLTKE